MPSFNQVQILHLSDVHFGKKHVFRNEDKTGSSAGIPPLENLIHDDLIDPSWKHFVWANTLPEKLPRLLLAVTGDVAEEAKQSEFDQACRFIQALIAKPILIASSLSVTCL